MTTNYDLIEWKKARINAKTIIAQALLRECNELQAEIDTLMAKDPTVILDQYPDWLQQLMVAYGPR